MDTSVFEDPVIWTSVALIVAIGILLYMTVIKYWDYCLAFESETMRQSYEALADADCRRIKSLRKLDNLNKKRISVLENTIRIHERTVIDQETLLRIYEARINDLLLQKRIDDRLIHALLTKL